MSKPAPASTDLPLTDRRFAVDGYGDGLTVSNAVFQWLNKHDKAALRALTPGASDHLYFQASGCSTQAKVARTV